MPEKLYTWDMLYARASGKAYGSPELCAKDEAFEFFDNQIWETLGYDIEKCDIPEEEIDIFLDKSDKKYYFDESGYFTVAIPSSLFNAGDGSRLIFKINGCTEKRMHEINLVGDELKIIQAIKNDEDLSLEFVKTGKTEFAGNLEYIDTRMIDVITTAMLVQTKYLQEAKSGDVKDIVNVVSEINPLNVMYPEHFYEAKFKDFLFASLAGLTASKKWDGKTRMTGGYIDVNKDGELLYYRAISNEIFCSYLYENTFIDRPDRGHNKDIAIAKAKAYFENRIVTDDEVKEIKNKKDKKGNCGFVFEENGEYFIAINFQVRFR